MEKGMLGLIGVLLVAICTLLGGIFAGIGTDIFRDLRKDRQVAAEPSTPFDTDNPPSQPQPLSVQPTNGPPEGDGPVLPQGSVDRNDWQLHAGDGTCPSEDQVQQAIGVPVTYLSGCAFKPAEGVSNSGTFLTVVCPPGYGCTLDEGDHNRAYKGDGSSHQIETGTFFPLLDVTFGDECSYLAYEYAHGVQIEPGNITCQQGQ